MRVVCHDQGTPMYSTSSNDKLLVVISSLNLEMGPFVIATMGRVSPLQP